MFDPHYPWNHPLVSGTFSYKNYILCRRGLLYSTMNCWPFQVYIFASAKVIILDLQMRTYGSTPLDIILDWYMHVEQLSAVKDWHFGIA